MLQSGIGEVVRGLPLVNALVRDDPEREVTWVVERTPPAKDWSVEDNAQVVAALERDYGFSVLLLGGPG